MEAPQKKNGEGFAHPTDRIEMYMFEKVNK